MKKLLTLALALVAIAAFSGLGVAQQKPEPTTTRKTVIGKFRLSDNGSLSSVKVSEVNVSAKTFTVMVNVNASNLPSLPNVGEFIDIIHTQTPGEPMMATTVRSGRHTPDLMKRNSSERLSDDKWLSNVKVLSVNVSAKTFTGIVNVNAANLPSLPKVGDIIDITYAQCKTTDKKPGLPTICAANLNFSKSNIN